MAEPLSVRERITAIANRLIPGNTDPNEIASFELSLVGLRWLVSLEVVASELSYRHAVLDVTSQTTASGREQVAKGTAAYARWLEAEATLDTVTEMLRTCRSNIRLQTEAARRG